MPISKAKTRSLLRTALWVVIIQFILINISAALYAYRFTHFTETAEKGEKKNLLVRTWRLFSGPRIQKIPLISQPSFSHESISLDVEGNRIDCWYSGKDTVNTCVILLHGYTANKSMYIHEAAAFLHKGYNVLLPDFRSHGSSSGKSTSLGFEEVAEVEEVVNYARKRGNQKIILYGGSMGAVVALRSVATGKVKVDAIVADMPFGSLQDHLRARARIVGFPEQPFAFFVTTWMGLQNGFNGFAHHTADYAAAVDCPVLLQWGDQDSYVEQEETAAVYQALKSPKKSLAVYAGVGHQSFLQADPIGWDKAISSFLGKL